MMVCHCNRVTAAEIEAHCLGGAATPWDVRARCGAGNRCGGCQPVVQRLVASFCGRDGDDGSCVDDGAAVWLRAAS